MVEPMAHKKQPICKKILSLKLCPMKRDKVKFICLVQFILGVLTFPKKLSRSWRYLEDKMAVTRTLNTPRVETNEAGANVYAMKLAASPMATMI